MPLTPWNRILPAALSCSRASTMPEAEDPLDGLGPLAVLVDAVDEEEVDLVDLQPGEAGFGLGGDLPPLRRASPPPMLPQTPVLVHTTQFLRRAGVPQVMAEDLLAAAVGRRGIEEVHAQVLGPGHGAGEPLGRDLEVRVAAVRARGPARVARERCRRRRPEPYLPMGPMPPMAISLTLRPVRPSTRCRIWNSPGVASEPPPGERGLPRRLPAYATSPRRGSANLSREDGGLSTRKSLPPCAQAVPPASKPALSLRDPGAQLSRDEEQAACRPSSSTWTAP